MLYIILIANSRVVTLIRPKKHSIHPAGRCLSLHQNICKTHALSDLHIIMNTIHSPSIFNSPASASWIPVCLPKFNPGGFVNAYITFLRKDDAVHLPGLSSSPLSPEDPETPVADTATITSDTEEGLNESGIALVSISAGGDFEMIRNWSDAVISVRTFPGTSFGTANLIYNIETHQRRKPYCSGQRVPCEAD